MTVTRRSARRRVQRLVAGLDIPDPYGIDALVEQVAAGRDRDITVVNTRMPTGLSGAWVQTPERDFLFCERETSSLHREHIVLHELGHMLCGHRPLWSVEQELVTLLETDVPGLTSQAVRHMLGRSRPSSPVEAEAELFAWLVRQRVGGPAGPPAAPGDADTPLTRLEEALGGGEPARGW
jgi:hypothetical protein